MGAIKPDSTVKLNFADNGEKPDQEDLQTANFILGGSLDGTEMYVFS